MCKPTVCGDGISNNPNAAGLNEVCGEPGLAAWPQGKVCNSCQCVDKPVSACGDGKADAGEQCGEPGLTFPQYQTCDNNCKCKTERVVTPRCGDGYVSSPAVGGGGVEECDIGGGYSTLVYPAAPDTCPPPKACVPLGEPN